MESKVKAKPDSFSAYGHDGKERRVLLQDPWFWAAMVLGLISCWVLALWLGQSGEVILPWSRWRMLVWLVVLYPVMEEWVFRGLLQTWLLRRASWRTACCGFSMANGGVTLLFAGMHLFTHSPGWAALVILPSLIFGWFRDRYNSILPGTLLHTSYNLAYFTLFGLPAA